MRQFDTVIIGAGPAGITAAIYACRAGLSTMIIEKMGDGGQILNTSKIDNYPGYPDGIQGWELADKFSTQLKSYDVVRVLDDVRAISKSSGDEYIIDLSDEKISSKTIILCTGAKHRQLGLEDEVALVGKGVSYCAICDGNFFRSLDVAVVGGGNSACEEALYLSSICSKVYLIHRRKEFRADMVLQKAVRSADNIELLMGYTVTRLNADNLLKSIDLSDLASGELRNIAVEGIFIFIGNDPQNQCVPAGVELDKHGFVITDAEMRTSMPGIFAAGDIRSKKCRQIITATGDGATAATSAFEYIQKGA